MKQKFIFIDARGRHQVLMIGWCNESGTAAIFGRKSFSGKTLWIFVPSIKLRQMTEFSNFCQIRRSP
jgi:hypothetical protein